MKVSIFQVDKTQSAKPSAVGHCQGKAVNVCDLNFFKRTALLLASSLHVKFLILSDTSILFTCSFSSC